LRIERELLLCKVSILGPEYFEDQLASKLDDARDVEHNVEEGTPAAYAAQMAADAAVASHPGASESHHAPAPLTPSEALRQKHMHLAAIEGLARNFGGKVVDVSHDCATVEVSAKTSRIDAFLKLIRPCASDVPLDELISQTAFSRPAAPARWSCRAAASSPTTVGSPTSPMRWPRPTRSTRRAFRLASLLLDSYVHLS